MLTEERNPRTMNLDELSTFDMLRVINEEDAKVAGAVQAALPQIAQAVDAITAALQKGGRLFYVGAGSSGRIALQDAVECVPTYSVPPGTVIGLHAGGEQALLRSVEGAEDRADEGRADLEQHQASGQDIVIGIAASGRTPYVLGAIAYAKTLGATTVGISCNQPAPLLDAVDIPIALLVGPEVVTGSTRMRAGTSQKMVLNMLSTSSMVRLGKVYGNLMVDVMPTNQKLVNRAQRIIAEVAGVPMETAANLLEQASGEVKTAIVIGRRNVSAEQARVLLNEAHGRLREVIG